MRAPFLILACLALAACGGARNGETNLRDLRSNQPSPEEFAIVPNQPLQTPETSALPVPTPGGTNRADLTPLSDAVVALGGRPGAGAAGDSALIAAATRNGVDPNVRQDLATEDYELRKRRSIFSWQLFRRDQYERAYANQTLNADAELDAWRASGAAVRNPSATPPAAR
ncbi:DUF3035 domain-containing protein [Litorisediminicola beolgyonensis]|uniref:DUF3035 domain-containing protein n=1 Tax=Litorisediminicola beolgyonensis TaxID=1173614 RepID=A0ABW3ZCV4_9RHOB